MQKYNFLTWWLSFSVKPLPYRIFKGIITTVMFIVWVSFVAVFTEYYWQFTLYGFLPVFVIDTVWEIINFSLYRKKYKEYVASNSSDADSSYSEDSPSDGDRADTAEDSSDTLKNN